MPTYSHFLWLGLGIVLALFVFPLVMGFMSNKSSNS